jgi:hypothetical protein
VPLPVPVREDRNAIPARAGLFRQKGPPEQRPHSERGQPGVADDRRVHGLARPAINNRHALPIVSRDRFEYVILIVNVREIRVRHILNWVLDRGSPDLYQPFRVFVGQRPKDNRIDDGEDGGVGADAERDRQNSRDGEATMLHQHACAIRQVGSTRLEEVHRSPTERLTRQPVGISHRTRELGEPGDLGNLQNQNPENQN